MLSYVFSMSYTVYWRTEKTGFGLFSGLGFLKVWDKLSVSLQGCTSKPTPIWDALG
jgi:hypothetical protein